MHCSSRLRVALLAASLVVACACQGGKGDKKGSGSEATGAASETSAKAAEPAPAKAPQRAEKLPPPPDHQAPPADATKTASGLAYEVLAQGDGPRPGPADLVKVHFTGWKSSSGDMFFTTRSRGQPQPMDLSRTSPGWTEALQLLPVGSKARLWMPPELAFKSRRGARGGEALVYDVELVEVKQAPPVPEDVAGPPKSAEKLPGGLAMRQLAPGTGKTRPRSFDTVVVDYTAWDTSGKMIDSTQLRGRPRPMMLFREDPGLEQALTRMVEGEKQRVWLPASLRKPRPGMPEGMLVYDLEVVGIQQGNQPPPVPDSVAKPPRSAEKTDKGVSYVLLERGKDGTRPGPADRVEVHYTGWTTDGRMFDSSVVRGKPAQFSLKQVIPGWTDGLQVLSPGDEAILWIPEELAYRGMPGKPAGMLVFRVKLLSIQ